MASAVPRLLQASRQLVRANSVQTSGLKNSLRVATAELGGDQATVGIFVNAGSSDDPVGSNGLSNIVGRIAASEANPAADGVIVKSVVSREQIGIIAHGATGAAAFQALSRAFGAISQGKDVAARQQEALADLNDIEMGSRDHVLDHLHSVAFQSNSLALSAHGSTKGISAVTSDSVKNFVSSHFTGSRVVVAGAGNVSHKESIALSEQLLGHLPDNSSHNFAGAPKAEYTGSMVLLRDDALPHVSVALAQRGAEVTSHDYWALRVAQSVIGNWNRQYGSSYLSSSTLTNATIFDEERVATALSTFYIPYRSTALFGVYAEADCEDAEDTCYHVMKEWIRVSETSGTTEIEKAKKRLIREILANRAGTIGLSQAIGSQILTTAHFQSADEIISAIGRVSRSDVRRVAGQYLVDQDLAVAAVGPTGWFPDYNQLRSWTYWNRL